MLPHAAEAVCSLEPSSANQGTGHVPAKNPPAHTPKPLAPAQDIPQSAACENKRSLHPAEGQERTFDKGWVSAGRGAGLYWVCEERVKAAPKGGGW